MSQKKGGNEGSSNVGSLLSDLLKDAKEGVAEEQQQRRSEQDRRAEEARENREREEGRKREEAQQKLIEETRRRNDALSRRERSENERKSLSTAPHMRVSTEQPDSPKSAELRVAAPPAKPANRLMLVGLVAAGIVVGLGGMLALTPSPKDSGIDIAAAAKAVVATTKKQATAEGRVKAEIAAAQKQIAELQVAVGEAQGRQKALQQQFDVLNADFKKATTQLADLKGTGTASKPPTVVAPPSDLPPPIDRSQFEAPTTTKKKKNK